ncbi:hypothetical protein COV18_05410 [Candidatus Woesearchaeota archaeon CG10_big_fil_rev_8_21_14_0_10_37_12]|nr:MAG: hypothetical protein COV18_05410 [Candidatus Woesearchaeota archaeon CG10_big_fil_rev_8_21_14_0_10_37_12]
MVSFDTAATISLVFVLALVVFFNRHKLSFQRFGIFYAAMYRTKAGISTMDKIAFRYKGFFEKATPWIIALGFLGMIVVTFDLARGLIMLLTQASTPAVGVVLPVKAKGVFYVPFLYWILSIFVILIIHEGMHGVMARVYNLPVKNSGLVVLGAIIPIIPGAFVEPDEKKLVKAPQKQQLAVYAAGPVSNLVTGLLLLGLMTFAIVPYTDSFYSDKGIVVTNLMDGNPPALQAGLQVGDMITEIDGNDIASTDDFSAAMEGKSPGDSVSILTAGATYDVTLGKNPQTDKAWLGIYVDRALENPSFWQLGVLWVKDFIFWLYLLSLGVGLFNLIPLGPIDGGRMFLTALERYTHENRAARIWKSVSFVLLGILITNVVLAFV